jgi:hypothetical protein
MNAHLRNYLSFVVQVLVVTLLPGCGSAAVSDFSKTPVLFVHGHGLSASDWDNAIEYLHQNGYPREYLSAVNIQPSRMGNILAAKTVIQPAAVSLLKSATRAAQKNGFKGRAPQQIDIVSHSMGAVSTRWFVSKLSPHLVRTWISLAGANHGSNALCNHNDDGAKDLCPAYATSEQESKVQIDLNGTTTMPIDETPYGLGKDKKNIHSVLPDKNRRILYFTVRIEPDEWIKPEYSAMLDGAGGIPIQAQGPVVETSPGNFLFRSEVDHDALPGHSELIRFVASLLAAKNF